MPLRDICRKSVICVSPEATALEAARLMKEHHVGNLVVVESTGGSPRPLGILTDRDLVTLVMAMDLSAADIKVNDIMVRNPVIARDTDGLYDVTRRMRQAAVRRMPVVDDSGRLCGIVSIDDIYQMLVREFDNLAAISAYQMSRERTGDNLSTRF